MPRLEQTLSNVKEGAKITLYWDSFNGYDDEYDHSAYDYSCLLYTSDAADE